MSWDIVAIVLILCVSIVLIVLVLQTEELREMQSEIDIMSCDMLNYQLTVESDWTWKKTGDYAREKYKNECLEGTK